MNLRSKWLAAALSLSFLAPLAHAAPPHHASAAPARGSYLVCVTNEGSGDLSIVDGVSHRRVATIPLGKRPRGIHASPDGRLVFVALSGTPIAGPPGQRGNTTVAGFPDGRAVDRYADGIGVVDLARRQVVRVIPAGSDPEEFALDRDGSHLYVSNEDAGTVSVVRVADGHVEHTVKVDNEPEGITLSPDGRSAYVACEANGSVFVIDGKTGERVARIATGGRPRSIAFSPDGSCAYVPSETDGRLNVVDCAALKLKSSFALPADARPMKAVMSPDGKTLYVTTGRGGTVSVIDVAGDRVRRTIKVGERPWGAALSPDGHTLFVANGPSDDLSVVDTRSGREIARVVVGTGPWGVAVVAEPKVKNVASR